MEDLSLKAHFDALLASRHEFYLRLFEEQDKRVALALAAKDEERGGKQWGMGTLISIAVALIALAAVLLKR